MLYSNSGWTKGVEGLLSRSLLLVSVLFWAFLLIWPMPVKAEAPAEAHVLRVPEALQQMLQVEVIDKARYPEQRLKRLVEFMFEPWGMGLEYDNSYTRTIEQGFLDRKGNCLSFTLTFVELARLAGLRAHMQETEHGLVSAPNDKTLLYTGHVNVSVRLNRRTLEVDFDRNRPLVRGQLNPVSAERALAHYYNNRGAELMSEADHGSADSHFEAALRLDPSMVSAHNNRGVLHLRLDNPRRAERHFQDALALDSRRIAVLSNLVSLYRSEAQERRAQEYEKRLESAQGSNPYYHFTVGLRLQGNGDHAEALEHFQQAARLDRKQPLYYFGMARSFAALGDEEQARKQERRALALNRRLTSNNQVINMMRAETGV
jgi:Flp pilus assembly protein TadD